MVFVAVAQEFGQATKRQQGTRKTGRWMYAGASVRLLASLRMQGSSYGKVNELKWLGIQQPSFLALIL
jgi:hypothetical protein